MDFIRPFSPLQVLANLMTCVVIGVGIWRFRREIVQAWRNRTLFQPHVYWGIALLYVISGATVTFPMFSAKSIGIGLSLSTMQIVAMFGAISVGLVHILARQVAMAVFNSNEISQRDRNHFHANWMAFWLLGLLTGLLPGLIAARIS